MRQFFSALLVGLTLYAHAQPAHLVISQVYAAGGNNGALYKYDFVELYNPTASDVSLTGWSLQYAGPSSTTWTNTNKVNLTGTVAAGKYFLIQLDGGTTGSTLPQPDFSSSTIVMSAAGGKVALVNSTTLLPSGCPSGGTVVDLVGWSGSSNTNCAEGTAVNTPTNYVNSVSRLNNGCTDADNNSTDFALTTPSPRNSASNGHTCNGNSISITAITTTPFCVDADNGTSGMVSYTTNGTFSNSTLKVVMSDANGSFGFSTVVGFVSNITGTNPNGNIAISIPANTTSGTAYRIRIEATNPPLIGNQSNAFEIINGAKNLLPGEFSAAVNNTFITLNWNNPSGCFDEIMIVAKEGGSINATPTGDGSAYTADLNFPGNGTPFDGGKVVYKGTTSGQAITNLTNGTTYYFKAFTRRGTNWSSGTEISDHPRVVPLSGEIVINQLSPDYNNSLDEYIELVNLTDKPFDLADVAIRIANGSGSTVVAGGSLSGILEPHSFWLASPNASITVGQTTGLARDNAVDGGFAATNNQIGLVRKTDNSLLDAVGYGSLSNRIYTEGTPVANPPTDGGLKRKISGADNNNNSVDFTTVTNANIELRNSTSRLANTNAAIGVGNYTVLEVTGNSSAAGNIILSDKVVLTNGIFSLGNYNLTIAKTTAGAALKYIKTNGSGTLVVTDVGTTGVTFPMGNSTYNPITISNGSNYTWSANVVDGVAPNAAFNRQYAVQRTWTITPSATLSSGATVVFEYDDNDASQLGSSFNKNEKVQVWTDHGGFWHAVTTAQTPLAVAGGRKAVTLSDYTQFSSFVIVNVNAPLPVHFTGFTARAQSGGVQLQFTNAAEANVQQYIVERSTDGQLFQTLIALSPQRNDGSAVTYRWFDAAPPAGAAWYRVKGIDKDGTVRFTPVLKLNNQGNTTDLTVYPNPVRGSTLVWQAPLPKGTYWLQVRNSVGHSVLQQRWEHSGGTRTETLSLPPHLPAGIYHLQIGNDTLVRQRLFLVQ